jgi:cell pole-organizing protein PopZ
MEDILASIRRILSEDEPADPAPSAEPHEDPDDVLVLDDSMLAHDAPAEAAHQLAERDELQPAEPPPAVRTEPPVAIPPPPPSPSPADLLGPEAAAAAASSVGSLVRTLAAERSTHVWRGGPTIEDLVREELRPLLKEWLDTNLPPLVERLVRAEIERVVGRAVP